LADSTTVPRRRRFPCIQIPTTVHDLSAGEGWGAPKVRLILPAAHVFFALLALVLYWFACRRPGTVNRRDLCWSGGIASLWAVFAILWLIGPMDLSPSGTRAIRTAVDLRTIHTALELYFVDHGRYPQHDGYVGPLAQQLEPTYVRRLPRIDTWGYPIEYESNGRSITLISHGAYGLPGPSVVDYEPKSFDRARLRSLGATDLRIRGHGADSGQSRDGSPPPK
jgi:hypothetical protein